MRRSLISALLAFAVAGLGFAQYQEGPEMAPSYPQMQSGDPQQQYPQYPQGQYSQAQNQYPQGQYSQYPQQYPAAQYPQASQPLYTQGGQYAPQPQPSPQDLAGDHQHGVARLSVADGEVNVRRGDNGELVAAATNAPLMTGDHLQTSPGSRAEVELDFGNAVRVAPNTDLGFGDVEYGRFQLQLGVGSISYRVLRDTGAQVEIDTPSIALHPAQPGEYRVSVYDDGTTQVSVRSGALEMMLAQGVQTLAAGQAITARSNGAAYPDVQPIYPQAWDQLDSWGRDRDPAMMNSQSYQYLGQQVAGGQDLDANGTWVPSQYGQVWEPQTPSPDWAPYSDGSWTYEPYYGWTWVDAAPWGWAPYHYGRWFMNGRYGWCWWPGAIASAVWSPALVGWFGAPGGLGWVALAPFETMFRWWGSGFGLSFGFHFGGGFGWHGGDIWHTYRNAGFRGGAMFANFSDFGRRGAHFGFAGRNELARASFVGGRIPVGPTHQSYSFAGRAASPNPRVNFAANRTFAHAAQWGRSFGAPTRFNGSNTIRGGQFAGNNSGWHSFGQVNGSATRQGSFGGQGDAWHSFGQAQHGMPTARGSSAYNAYTQGSANRGYNSGAYNSGANRSFGGQNQVPRYNSPQYSAPRYNAPQYSAPRYSAPQYSAPRYSTPRYSMPQGNARSYSAPSYGASRGTQPHYSGDGSYHGGGGGSHGGGGGHSGGGHSGGGHSGGGGGGGHHR